MNKTVRKQIGVDQISLVNAHDDNNPSRALLHQMQIINIITYRYAKHKQSNQTHKTMKPKRIFMKFGNLSFPMTMKRIMFKDNGHLWRDQKTFLEMHF